MKKNVLILSIAVGLGVTAFLAGTAVSGEAEEMKAKMAEMPPPPQLTALDAFVGEWRSAYEHLPAMFGEPGKGIGDFHCKWVLDNRFLMGELTSNSSFGTYQFVWMATYDPTMQSYRSFGFDNHGTCNVATMVYQPESKTWIEVSDGFDMAGKPAKNKTTMRFAGKDKLEWEWYQKTEREAEFKLLMRGTDTRVPQSP